MRSDFNKYQRRQYISTNIFVDSIKLLIKSKDKAAEETRKLDIEWRESQSPISRKDLSVTLTDETDPLYLYCLLLTQEDYQHLKSDQTLVVDFNGFPNQLVELLLLTHSKDPNDSSRYLVEFDTTINSNCDAVLSIKEITKFKHLTHLSLKFSKSDDNSIKYYLSDQIYGLKEEIDELKKQFSYTQTSLKKELEACKDSLESRNSECLKLQSEIKEITSNLSSKYAKDVSAEKDRVLQTQIELTNKLEYEKREINEKFYRQVSQLEARLGGCEAQNKDLTEKKYKLEMTVKDLQSKLSLLEEESSTLRQETNNLRRNNLALDESNHLKEKELHKLQTNEVLLEHRCTELERIVKQQEDVIESRKWDKKQQDDQIQNLIDNLGKKDVNLKSIGQELMKANEIIQKLQEQTKIMHGKLKLRSRVTSEQAKTLEEKDKQVIELQTSVQEVRQTVKTKDDQIERLRSQLEEHANKIESLEKIVKANENLISWLNRQLSEREVLEAHRGQHSQPSSKPKPSSDKMTHSTPVVRDGFNGMSTMGSSIPGKSRDFQLISKEDIANLGLEEQYLMPDDSMLQRSSDVKGQSSRPSHEKSKLPTALGKTSSTGVIRGSQQKSFPKAFSPELILTPPLAANYFPK